MDRSTSSSSRSMTARSCSCTDSQEAFQGPDRPLFFQQRDLDLDIFGIVVIHLTLLTVH